MHKSVVFLNKTNKQLRDANTTALKGCGTYSLLKFSKDQ